MNIRKYLVEKLKKSNLKKKPREFVILTAFTVLITEILWLPLGGILNFNGEQWIIWLTGSVPYDFVFGYISAKLIIKFNDFAKKKKWY